jgi:hypothetical protein
MDQIQLSLERLSHHPPSLEPAPARPAHLVRTPHRWGRYRQSRSLGLGPARYVPLHLQRYPAFTKSARSRPHPGWAARKRSDGGHAARASHDPAV